MYNNTRFIKLSLLADRVNNLGLAIAAVASDAVYDGYSIAVVAEETAALAKRLRQMVEECLEPTFDLQRYVGGADILLQTELLGLNCMIVGSKIKETKKLLVYGEELMRIAALCADILEIEYDSIPLQTRKVYPKSRVLTQTVMLLTASYNGFKFVENVQFIEEIIYGCSSHFENGYYDLRGIKLPIIHLGNNVIKWETHENKYLLIMKSSYDDDPKKFGVLIERPEFGCIFPYNVGLSTKASCDEFYGCLVRECWNTKDLSQLYFMDWGKII